MIKNPLYCFIILILVACSSKKYKYPNVLIETQFGDIQVELYPDKAPKSVAAFLSYVDSGVYKNSSFYRVLKEENQPSSGFKTELIQGGIWQSNNKIAIGLKGIPHETTKQTGLKHANGTISLARTTPGTASSEFFICVGDQPAYDYGNDANPDKLGYAAFGKVVKGMAVVHDIYDAPEYEQLLDPPVMIFSIKRL